MESCRCPQQYSCAASSHWGVCQLAVCEWQIMAWFMKNNPKIWYSNLPKIFQRSLLFYYILLMHQIPKFHGNGFNVANQPQHQIQKVKVEVIHGITLQKDCKICQVIVASQNVRQVSRTFIAACCTWKSLATNQQGWHTKCCLWCKIKSKKNLFHSANENYVLW